ncbi:ATP-binding protein [Nitrosomonas sp.]|uniref:ATP-binding protein n=1 Tax=Nitrosomonas sp. TaxID=42353 RepID=UPI0033065CFE
MNTQARGIDSSFDSGHPDRPYAGASEYLRDRMALLSLKLHREVLLMRAVRGNERQESFLGLFISDQDIDALLAELHGSVVHDFPDGDSLSARMDKLHRAMLVRLSLGGPALPHQRLAEAFALQGHELDLLLMAVAPELDNRFARVFGFLHDDVSRKRLSAGLALQLLGSGDELALALRQSLHPDSPLLRFRLLQVLDDDSHTLFSRGLKPDNRIASFLLGLEQRDEELAEVMIRSWSSVRLTLRDDACTRSAVDLQAQWQARPSPLVLELATGADVDVWLMLFCGQAGLGVMTIDWPRLVAIEPSQAARVLRKAVREAHLSGILLHLRDVDDRQPRLYALLMSLATPLLCLSSARALPLQEMALPPLGTKVVSLSAANRLACWQASVPEGVALDEGLLQTCANRYPIGVRAIEHVCRHLPAAPADQSGTGDARESVMSADPFPLALRRACRQQVGERMRDVAQRIETGFDFSDLVLPPLTMIALREIVERQANTTTVFQDWGLGSVFRQSEGCAVLFVGPSGTGKTMAASVVANELGLDMYRVDLSGVVSKYIGETEKNLERIFTAAAQSEVVLFIDEADALFGKRSEVKDAHDRYANIEVSYLLQKMEEHKGVVVLASNFCQNIDDAFFRRFSAVVEFNSPGVGERLRLWEKLQQSRTPLAENIDLLFLAERFELSGGHIRNCIMTAAFQAAAQAEALNMQMLIRAVSREYAKLGKPISKNSFGDYYAAVRRESAGG